MINTGPLLALSRAEVLDVVGNLPYDFLCPTQVRAELDVGESLGYPSVRPAWLQVREPGGALDPLATAALDAGEAAVIALALSLEHATVCIDEAQGGITATAGATIPRYAPSATRDARHQSRGP